MSFSHEIRKSYNKQSKKHWTQEYDRRMSVVLKKKKRKKEKHGKKSLSESELKKDAVLKFKILKMDWMKLTH